MNNHELGNSGHSAIAAACIIGLACAAVGGMAGLLAIAWIGVTLVVAWRGAAPKVGVTALGVAAIYGLAALSAFGGTDPEDVDPGMNLRLAVVAIGCAVVGLTSALVLITSVRGDSTAGSGARRLDTARDPGAPRS